MPAPGSLLGPLAPRPLQSKEHSRPELPHVLKHCALPKGLVPATALPIACPAPLPSSVPWPASSPLCWRPVGPVGWAGSSAVHWLGLGP